MKPTEQPIRRLLVITVEDIVRRNYRKWREQGTPRSVVRELTVAAVVRNADLGEVLVRYEQAPTEDE